jgi:hypothetical protein
VLLTDTLRFDSEVPVSTVHSKTYADKGSSPTSAWAAVARRGSWVKRGRSAGQHYYYYIVYDSSLERDASCVTVRPTLVGRHATLQLSFLRSCTVLCMTS